MDQLVTPRDGVAGSIGIRSDGDGPPVLFLHGLGGTRAAWEPQLESLSPDFRCIAWDMPGYGVSAPLPAPLTFEAIADAAAQLLDDLDIARADIVGLSFGGQQALHLALRHPDRIRRLVLADTSARFGADGTDVDEWKQLRLAPLDDGRTVRELDMAFLYQSTELGAVGEDEQFLAVVSDVGPVEVLSYGMFGRRTAARTAEALTLLQEAIADDEAIEAAGPPRLFGYHSPMVPIQQQYFEGPTAGPARRRATRPWAGRRFSVDPNRLRKTTRPATKLMRNDSVEALGICPHSPPLAASERREDLFSRTWPFSSRRRGDSVN